MRAAVHGGLLFLSQPSTPREAGLRRGWKCRTLMQVGKMRHHFVGKGGLTW